MSRSLKLPVNTHIVEVWIPKSIKLFHLILSAYRKQVHGYNYKFTSETYPIKK